MSCNSATAESERMRGPRNRQPRQSGTATIEFAFCVGLFWLPLFLGATQFGFELIQAIQVTQVCRDAGHLYAYGISFSQSSNQYLLASFAPNLNVDPTGQGGTSVVILSTVNYIDLAECQAGGYISTCPNYGNIVFTNRLVVGNAGLHASVFGTPTTDSSGTGKVPSGGPTTNGYLNQTNDVVESFPNISLSTGSTGQQTAYISEMYSQSSSLSWFLPSGPWVSGISFF
jgi:hypothetical protein